MWNLDAEQRLSAWRKGDLLWKLHKGQWAMELAFLESRGKLFVADCSRQLGKSIWCVKKACEKAIKKPKARIRYATAFLSDLEQFILPAFDLILDGCPVSVAPRYMAAKARFVFPNGSEIRLVGLDRRPNGLRGNKLDMVIMDECGYISRLEYLYKYVIIPATTHVPDARIIMASTQPDTPDHDFIKFCDRAEIEECYVKLDIDQNPMLTKEKVDDIAVEYAPIDLSLSRDEKIKLGRASTAFRREYMCERVVEESRAIIPEFRESKHVAEQVICPAHKYWRRMEALDSGVRDMTGFLMGYYDFARSKLCIEDEFAIQGHEVTTRRIAELAREKEALHKYDQYANVLRIADNDNLILLQDLGTEFELYFGSTSKDEVAAMVNKVRMWMAGGRIEINPRCKRLISSLKAGIWTPKRDQFARSALHGHYDLISALVYMVRNIPEQDNPVPHYFNQNLSEVVLLGQQRPSTGAAALKKAFAK